MLDGILSLFGLERRSTLANPSPDLMALFGAAPTASGVSVSAETAMRSPTLCATVRVICETVAGLPVHLYRRGTDGSRERDTSHPAAKLLSGTWCPWAGGVETRTALQLDALLYGAGYSQVVRVPPTSRPSLRRPAAPPRHFGDHDANACPA